MFDLRDALFVFSFILLPAAVAVGGLLLIWPTAVGYGARRSHGVRKSPDDSARRTELDDEGGCRTEIVRGDCRQ
jgi:hypothetical protein